MSVEAQQAVFHIDSCIAVLVCCDVAKITNMSLGSIWRSMLFLMRIEVAASCHSVVRVDTKLVNVESMLARGQSADLCMDVNLVSFFEEGYPPLRFAILGRKKDGNSLGMTSFCLGLLVLSGNLVCAQKNRGPSK